MAKLLNIFFVGDINGKPGMTLISSLLKQYIQKYEIDFCVVNGENVTEGKGIDETDAKALFGLGVHVIPRETICGIDGRLKRCSQKSATFCVR